MRIDEIKEHLENYDDRFPLEPPRDRSEEIWHDHLKMRGELFKDQSPEYVRYLLSKLEVAETEFRKIIYSKLANHNVKVKEIILIADDALEKLRS